jgi:hypothetical protein
MAERPLCRRNDYVRIKCDQFSREFAGAVCIAFGRTTINLQIASLNPTQLLQRLRERHPADLIVRIVCGWASGQYPDAAHPIWLLRAHHKWPRGRSATNHFDEIAPPHGRLAAQERASYHSAAVLRKG